MRLQRTIESNLLIRACLTEDKDYCYSVSGSDLIWRAIDTAVAQEVAKVVEGVGCFRVEHNDGRLMGYALITITGLRQVLSSFIRPLFRGETIEFNDSVEQGKNTILPLLTT